MQWFQVLDLEIVKKNVNGAVSVTSEQDYIYKCDLVADIGARKQCRATLTSPVKEIQFFFIIISSL